MNNEPRLLEVGDELVQRSGWNGDVFTIHPITRVTAHFAFSDNYTKYQRQLRTKYAGRHTGALEARVAGGGYEYHELITDAIRDEMQKGQAHRSALARCRGIDFKRLTTEQLEAIAAIVETKPNTENQ
jgi:hypothetical protein